MANAIKQRDGRLDVLKGLAISLVVLGHILQGCYDGYDSLMVFNVIWSLQIPLFMVVSGYFASKKKAPVGQTILKKAKSYLIPFVSCFLIRELLILGNQYQLWARTKVLMFALEESLWYLFVLFELSLVHLFASRMADMCAKRTSPPPKTRVRGLVS